MTPDLASSGGSLAALRRRLADPRNDQIAALATLLVVNLSWLDFGARPLPSLFAIAAALGTQWACARFWRLPRLELRSALITGLPLSLLLRADAAWIQGVAAAIAILSKFTLRLDGKHVWNPAGFAIVVLLAATDRVWISPGQWGASLWFAALLGCFAVLVLRAARRGDIAVFFLVAHGGLLVARALWLGDPLAIPLHQLESGSVLIFAFFMISDPRAAPDSRGGRLCFAIAVAALAYALAFFLQLRPALYVSLFALSPVTLYLNWLMPAERFAWNASVRPAPAAGPAPRRPSEQGASR